MTKDFRGVRLLGSCVQRLPLAMKVRTIWKGPEGCGQTQGKANKHKQDDGAGTGPTWPKWGEGMNLRDTGGKPSRTCNLLRELMHIYKKSWSLLVLSDRETGCRRG